LSEEIKKYILNLCSSDLPSELLEICNELSLQVTTDPSEFSEDNFVYVLVDSAETESPISKPILCLESCSDDQNFFKKNGKGIINKSILTTEIGKILIKRLFGDASSLSFEKAFDGGLNEAKSLKLENFFKVGSVCDVISKDAFKMDFNFIAIRNFFNSLASFFGILSQSDIVGFPVEVDYGQSDECFVIQSHVSIENFDENSLLDSFGVLNNLSPFHSLLKICSKQADIIDCYILESSSRLVITGIWLKEDFTQLPEFSSSILLNNIKSFKRIEADQIKGTVESKPVVHEINESELEEKHNSQEAVIEAPVAKSSDEDFSFEVDNIVKVKRVIEFIRRLRKLEESAKPEGELTLEDVESYLDSYPNKKAVSCLTQKDKVLILRGLKDIYVFENIQKDISKVSEGVNLETIEDSFITRLESLSVDDASEIVSMSVDNHDESVTRVRGWVGDSDSETTIVNGQKEELTQKAWTVKKSEIIEDVKEAITILKGDGKDINELEREVVAVISGKLDISNDESATLVKGLLDNASEDLFIKQLPQSTPVESVSDSQHVRDRLQIEKLEGDVKTREGQLLRLKKVIDGMKLEIQAFKTVGKSHSLLSDEEKDLKMDFSKSEAALSKARQELDNQRKITENLKDANANLNANNEKKISELESRLEALAPSIDDGPSDSEKVIVLEREKQSLETKLEVATTRIENLSSNLDKQTNSAEDRKSDIIEKMEGRINLAQTALTKFREEKEEMILRITSLEKVKEKLTKAVEEKASSENNNEFDDDIMKEKDMIIDELSNSLKTAEESLKETTLKSKQLEQKNKFLNAQVEEAKKAAKKASKGNGSKNGGDPALQRKVKQLELINTKIAQSNDKNAKDLVERKKEALKYKTEVTKLTHKISELERKLNKAA